MDHSPLAHSDSVGSAYRTLWLAVVNQIAIDYNSTCTSAYDGFISDNYLESEDFDLVCNLAGLDQVFARRQIRIRRATSPRERYPSPTR